MYFGNFSEILSLPEKYQLYYTERNLWGKATRILIYVILKIDRQ